MADVINAVGDAALAQAKVLSSAISLIAPAAPTGTP